MKLAKGLINLEKEFNAVLNFVKLRWETGDNIETMLRKAWDKGLVLYNDQSSSKCTDNLYDYVLKSENFSYFMPDDMDEDMKHYHPYNLYINKFLKIGYKSIFTPSSLNFNYSDIDKYLNSILKEYPEYKKMKPLGWDELKKVYSEYMGMEEYNSKKDSKDFKGHEVNDGERTFPLNISLANVMYDELEQGRNRTHELLNYVLIHATNCKKHNNDVILQKELEKVDKYFRSFEKDFPFDVSFKGVTTNKFLLQVFDEVKGDFLTKEAYEEKKKQKEDYDNLPQEEKDERKRSAAEFLSKLLNDVLNKND